MANMRPLTYHILCFMEIWVPNTNIQKQGYCLLEICLNLFTFKTFLLWHIDCCKCCQQSTSDLLFIHLSIQCDRRDAVCHTDLYVQGPDLRGGWP